MFHVGKAIHRRIGHPVGGCAENAGPENGGPIIPKGQKVENAGLENAGPRQLSDSTLKL